MIKLVCSNEICQMSFFFDEDKFPNAKKVQCPHCKTIQLLKKENEATPSIPKSDEDDWMPPKKETHAPNPRTEPKIPKNSTADSKGWLVIHDENTSTVSFMLQKGKNAIGRKSESTPKEVNISINTQDNYMSRHHCDIIIEFDREKEIHVYQLSDGALGKKKPSTNGTFLNAKGPMRPDEIWRLKDGDTIQAGRTKLVLKLPGFVKDAKDAENQVGPTDYFQTIIQ